MSRKRKSNNIYPIALNRTISTGNGREFSYEDSLTKTERENISKEQLKKIKLIEASARAAKKLRAQKNKIKLNPIKMTKEQEDKFKEEWNRVMKESSFILSNEDVTFETVNKDKKNK